MFQYSEGDITCGRSNAIEEVRMEGSKLSLPRGQESALKAGKKQPRWPWRSEDADLFQGPSSLGCGHLSHSLRLRSFCGS